MSSLPRYGRVVSDPASSPKLVDVVADRTGILPQGTGNLGYAGGVIAEVGVNLTRNSSDSAAINSVSMKELGGACLGLPIAVEVAVLLSPLFTFVPYLRSLILGNRTADPRNGASYPTSSTWLQLKRAPQTTSRNARGARFTCPPSKEPAPYRDQRRQATAGSVAGSSRSPRQGK